ncbi:MAG: bile acid:sodium symporter [Fuerstiella sp.]|nr:bile acid:sodium symporter [Fuerstiella sp.]
MISFFQRHWFLVWLLILIPLGIVLGHHDLIPGLATLIENLPTSACTGAILFLMSVTLDTGKLMQSLRRPYPVITACSINMLFVPLLCLPMLTLQQTPDFKVGLLIAACVPCTMAAASVWTRKAEGNDAVSLLVTLVTNGFCFLLIPVWMEVGRVMFGTADTSDTVSFGGMMLLLIFGALLPALLGQVVRTDRTVRSWVDRKRTMISGSAQVIILSLVFISSFKGGQKIDFGGSGALPHQALLIVWGSCIVLHLAAAGAGWLFSGLFGFAEGDRRAIVLAGSQKTLPVGLLVSEATGMPFSIIPMLLFHGSQLFIDTWIAGRLQQRGERTDSVE